MFKRYRKSGITELLPYNETMNMDGVTVGQDAIDSGSPKVGDMIARDPENHDDMWLVPESYFEANYEIDPVTASDSIYRDIGVRVDRYGKMMFKPDLARDNRQRDSEFLKAVKNIKTRLDRLSSRLEKFEPES